MITEVEKLHTKIIHVKLALIVSEKEFAQVSVIVDSLLPVRLTAKNLCRWDSDLITSDTIMTFLLNKIVNQKTDLTEPLRITLEIHIQEKTDMSSVFVIFSKS